MLSKCQLTTPDSTFHASSFIDPVIFEVTSSSHFYLQLLHVHTHIRVGYYNENILLKITWCQEQNSPFSIFIQDRPSNMKLA